MEDQLAVLHLDTLNPSKYGLGLRIFGRAGGQIEILQPPGEIAGKTFPIYEQVSDREAERAIRDRRMNDGDTVEISAFQVFGMKAFGEILPQFELVERHADVGLELGADGTNIKL